MNKNNPQKESDEIVAVVDAHGNQIAYISKTKTHQTGALHPVIIAELINSKGEWTLVKQAQNRQDPGQFVSPVGGHIRAGESEKHALIRETNEELGIDLTQETTSYRIKRISQAIFNRHVNNRHENHLFFVYEIYSDQTPILNYESVSYKRFKPTQLHNLLQTKHYLFGAPFHFVWQQFYQTGQS